MMHVKTRQKCIIYLLIWILITATIPITTEASTGTLTDKIEYNGISGYLWIPATLDKSVGFIWCMPGTGGLNNGISYAYEYVKNDLIKPHHVVFFVDYKNNNGSDINTHINDVRQIIKQIKSDYDLNDISDDLFYYGFSKGAYFFGQGFSTLEIWDEAILNDGGCENQIYLGRLRRIAVVQGTENNIDDYNEKFLGTDVAYTLINFHNTGISDIHAKCNAWAATNDISIYKQNEYYDEKMGDTTLGLDWFQTDNIITESIHYGMTDPLKPIIVFDYEPSNPVNLNNIEIYYNMPRIDRNLLEKCQPSNPVTLSD